MFPVFRSWYDGKLVGVFFQLNLASSAMLLRSCRSVPRLETVWVEWISPTFLSREWVLSASSTYQSTIFVHKLLAFFANKLTSQCMMDKRTLIDLREELVKEKMAAEKLSGQLEMMSSQLAGVGISLKNDGSLDGIDNIQRSKQEEIKVANEAEGDELSCELAKLRVAAVGCEDREVAMSGELSWLQEEVATVTNEKACLQLDAAVPVLEPAGPDQLSPS